MNRATLSIAIAILMLFPSTVMACTVAPWPGDVPPTPEMIAEQFLFTPSAFFGKVGIRDIVQEDHATVTYTMDVLKQYAGNRIETISATTDQTSSCAFSGQEDMTTLLYIPQGEVMPYNVNMTSNYFYGVSEREIEAYLDAKQTSGE